MSLDNCASETVSIIIPAFNCETYLDECLRSVLLQTYKHFEVILVDDGSTDGTAKKCDEWAEIDKRVRVIHQANSGPSAARNRGYLECAGDWVWFVDADDVIDANSVEMLLSDAHGCNADLVAMGIRPFDSSGDLPVSMVSSAPFPSVNKMEGDSFLKLLVKSGIETYLWSYFFRADTLRRFSGMGNPLLIDAFRLFEDAAFVFQLSLESPTVRFEDRGLYGYRQVDSSSSHEVSLAVAKNGYEAVSFLCALDIPAEFRRDMSEKVLSLLVWLYGQVAPSRASYLFRKTVKRDVVRLMGEVGIQNMPIDLMVKCSLITVGLYLPTIAMRNLATRVKTGVTKRC